MAAQRLEHLPVFPLPDDLPPAATHTLRIEGLVETPRALTLAHIRALPANAFTAEFACEDGWSVPALRWRGARLLDVLALAGVLPEARYVAIGSGEFVAVAPLAQIAENSPLLAYELDGAPLPAEHGGPLRLVAPWTACFQSVKWVDRLVASADASSETASTLARARNAARR